MWKWVLIAACIMLGLPNEPVAAKGDITMEVKLPFGGIAKTSQWTQIEVVVTNNGEPLNGTLHLSRADQHQQKREEVELKQEITLKDGENKSYIFEIPAEYLTRSRMEVAITEGTETIHSQMLYPLPENHQRMVGVVDKNPNAFYFFSQGGQTADAANGVIADPHGGVAVKHVNEEDLPEKSWLYNHLNVLVLGNLDEKNITDEQIAAIREWVQHGGVLILSAAGDHQQLIEEFADILPFKQGNSGIQTNMQLLKDLTGAERLPVSSLAVHDKNLPLLFTKKWGAGLFVYANYDVTAEPLASWQYNRQLWHSLLKKHGYGDRPQDFGMLYRSGTMAELSRLIPGVSTPSAEKLAVIWLVYLLVVAPLLYLVLKRKDRREWAWAIIPAVAIFMSLGVYGFGKIQVAKRDAAYSVSNIQIQDPNLAHIQTVTSFLTLKGGEVAYRTEKDVRTIPFDRRTDMWMGSAQILQQEDGSKMVAFENVPYLSMKQAFAMGPRKDAGAFAADLHVEDNQINGKVKNNTSFDLEETYLALGQQRLPIGPLKRGEEKQVALPFQTVYMQGGFSDHGFFERRTPEEIRDNLKKDVTLGDQTSVVRLIGISSQAFPVMTMESEHDEYHWNVLSQKVMLHTQDKTNVVYPYGALAVEVVNQEGTINTGAPHMWQLEKGSITYALTVNSLEIEATKITVPLNESPYLPFVKEIYHLPSKSWKPLNRDQRLVLQTDLREYVNAEGRILLRFTNKTEQRLTLPDPVFMVEGKEWTAR